MMTGGIVHGEGDRGRGEHLLQLRYRHLVQHGITRIGQGVNVEEQDLFDRFHRLMG